MKLILIMLVLVTTLVTPVSMAQAQTKSKANKTEQTSQRKIVYDLSVADTTMRLNKTTEQHQAGMARRTD